MTVEEIAGYVILLIGLAVIGGISYYTLNLPTTKR